MKIQLVNNKIYLLSDLLISDRKYLICGKYYYVKNHYNEWYIGKYQSIREQFIFIDNQGTFDALLFKAYEILGGEQNGLLPLDYANFKYHITKLKTSAIYQDICDKLINPIDAISVNLSFHKDTDNYEILNELVEKIKVHMDKFRKIGYELAEQEQKRTEWNCEAHIENGIYLIDKLS